MYFITTVTRIDNKIPNYDGMRTIGFSSNFEKAEKAVLNNACDMNETIYDYAVIEELEEGLYPSIINSFYYKFDYDIKKYNPISSDTFDYWEYVRVG